MTDASGAVVWDRVATPFGVEVQTTGALTQPLKFPGQVEDLETSLFQNWNRDYDASLGRYVQSDPIGLMGGINTYAYVEGNPLIAIDQNGLEVTATFNRTTGQLTVTNNDSGRTASANNAFSGNTNQGYSPAPTGTYSISDFPWGRSLQDHYFALLRHDERLDDYADGFPSNYQCDRPDQQCTMNGLRLHAGFASHGCVTVPGLADSEPWASIQDILDNTARGDPIEIGGQSYPNFGTLTITD